MTDYIHEGDGLRAAQTDDERRRAIWVAIWPVPPR